MCYTFLNVERDTTIMEILSFNVNQFLQKESWTEYTSTEIAKSELQEKNIEQLSKYLLDFLNQNKNNLVILQEVPKNSAVFKKFMEKFDPYDDPYEIILPCAIKDRHPVFVTMAISRKNWVERPFPLSSCHRGANEVPSYYNRVVVVENKNKNIVVVGVHIPAASYEPAASVLWDDIFYYCKQKNPQIIIGDLNVDKEQTIQARKLSELKAIGYEEAKGTATKISPGIPPTCDTKSHVDYALVKDINIESYAIDNEHKDLSDHYPIILSIKEEN